MRIILPASLQRRRFQRQVQRADRPRIVVGASGEVQPGWIGSEASYLNLLAPAQWAQLLGPKQLDSILAEHVWEHLTPRDAATAAETCFRFLRPGGRLRIAVPDGRRPDPDYIDAVRPGGTGSGADDHQVLYDVDSLSDVLRDAGFDVQPLEYFRADGSFVDARWSPHDGLVRRSKALDPRNVDTVRYTSLIVDGIKPPESIPR